MRSSGLAGNGTQSRPESKWKSRASAPRPVDLWQTAVPSSSAMVASFSAADPTRSGSLLIRVRVRLRQVAFQQIFVVLHTPPFHEFLARLHARPDARVLDGFGVGFRIIPYHHVFHVIGVNQPEPFGDMQLVAGRMFGSIDPGLAIEAG